MKLRCMYFFSFTLLLAPCVISATSTNTDLESESLPTQLPTGTKQGPKLVQDYETPIQFMSDFLDVTRKPDMPLKYWALQLVLLLRSNARLKPFCNKLKNVALDKQLDLDQRVRNINNAFVEAFLAQLFPEDLSKFIFDRGLPTVKASIKKRAEKIS